MEQEVAGEKGLTAIMGLEIHVQLNTASKLFCRCETDYQHAKGPNENVCPTCTAQPGSKPYDINSHAVESAIKIALALECKRINPDIVMQRKHYFYPDLPSNYQRTSTPLGEKGTLAGVTIREVHLEEDPGRYDLKSGLVDYNRAGVPLVEIVTDPEITSPDHARRFLEELRAVLDYLDAARGEETGSMRADANVSIKGHKRVEVKNINSFHGVFSALTYEISRQRNMVKNGLGIVQETRHFDEDREITVGLRKKESVDDYRYIPDPDVQPIVLEKSVVERIRKALPELPAQKMARFCREYGASEDEAFALCLEKDMADAFERITKKTDAKLAAKFMRGVLRKQLNFRAWVFKRFAEKKLEGALAGILALLEKKQVTDKVAEQLLVEVMDGKIPGAEKPGAIESFAKTHGLVGVHGSQELAAVVDGVLAENPQPVADYRAGNAKALQFLAGKVMAATKGKADPSAVQELLAKKLGERK